MKRAFPQKVKSVPSRAADNDALAELSDGKLPEGEAGTVRPTSSEVRRARTSAAMIGLAISVGASSLLLPGQGDEAIAASEPITAEPTTATVGVASEKAVVSPATKIEPEAAVVSSSKAELAAAQITPPTVEHSSVAANTPAPSSLLPVREVNTRNQQPLAIEHKVKPGQTLWNVSQKYQVNAAAIAASDKSASSSALASGQVLKVPSVNGIVHEVKAGDSIETISTAYGVPAAQIETSLGTNASGSLPVGESVVIPGNVNNLLKARQNSALNNLKEHRNRLQTSLAELGSEESTNKSELVKAANGSSSVVAQEDQTAAVPPPAVEAEVPMVTAPQQVVTVPSPGISPLPSPAAISPKAATIPSPGISPLPSPGTPTVIPSLIPPKAATIPSPGISPLPSPGTPTVIPSLIPPKAATTPAIGSAKTPAVSATPELQSSLVVEPQVAEPGDVYQVKPGDTLNAIAQAHGVSQTEIIRLNRLENPNLIQVNQKLAIPQSQPSGPSNSVNLTLPEKSSRQQFPAVPSLTVPNLSTAIAVPAPLQERDASSKKGSVNAISSASTGVETTAPAPTVLVAKEVTQSSNSLAKATNNPYVEKLRSEILKLREQYRVQQEGTSVKVTTDVTVPTVTLKVPPASNNTATPSQYLNPEFSPNRYNEALRRSSPSQKPQLVESAPITIRVPPPDNPKQGVVATAPAGSDFYNPSMQPPLGRTVSPELTPEELPNGSHKLSAHLIWPTKGVLTSGYGMRWGRMHKGIDIAAPVGTPVMAAASGVVVYARWNSGGYGNMVDIQHADGSLTRYAHNHKILVREGQTVEQGQQISEMGSTGYSTGPHCHFEVHPPGKGAVNPIAFLPPK